MILKNFIVLEGIDGAGKSTQAKLLAQNLTNKIGEKVFLTKEPTDSNIGHLIREVLGGKDKMDAETLQRLFSADRSLHFNQKDGINDQLNKGKIIICDRYLYSGIAYNEIHSPLGHIIKDINSNFPEPQVTIYLRVKSEKSRVIFDRLQARNNKKEIYDNVAKQLEVARNYDEIFLSNTFDSKRFSQIALNNDGTINIKGLSDRYLLVIDASKNIDEVASNIWNIFEQLLKTKLFL